MQAVGSWRHEPRRGITEPVEVSPTTEAFTIIQHKFKKAASIVILAISKLHFPVSINNNTNYFTQRGTVTACDNAVNDLLPVTNRNGSAADYLLPATNLNGSAADDLLPATNRNGSAADYLLPATNLNGSAADDLLQVTNREGVV